MDANSLLVHFAGNAIRFRTDVKEIREGLAFHFRHASANDVPIIADYEINAGSNGHFSATLNDETLFSNLNYHTALWHLTQDAITQLNGTATEELVFHAATVTRGEDAAILCGKSGSGKSSLAAWLVAEGLGYMTDEVISRPLREQVIHGLNRSIVLKRGSAFIWQHWLADAPSEAMLRFQDDSVWIEPTRLNAERIAPTAIPRILLFPTYQAEAGFQLKQLSTADALFRLLQNLVNARNFADHGFAETSRLAQQGSAYEIIFSDIEKASAWIRKRLTTD